MNQFTKRIRTTLLLRHDLSHLDATCVDGDVAIDALSNADVDLLAEVNPDIERILEMAKFAAGQKCYCARLADRLAHYSWVQDSGVHIIAGSGQKRRVLEGDLWIYACFTAPWARGRRIYPTVLTRILRDHKALGFRNAWIYFLDGNVASQKGISRAGFKFNSKLRSLSVRGLTIPLP